MQVKLNQLKCIFRHSYSDDKPQDSFKLVLPCYCIIRFFEDNLLENEKAWG